MHIKNVNTENKISEESRREKGNGRTIPTTTCKEKTNAEHANNHTRSKLRVGIPLVF